MFGLWWRSGRLVFSAGLIRYWCVSIFAIEHCHGSKSQTFHFLRRNLRFLLMTSLSFYVASNDRVDFSCSFYENCCVDRPCESLCICYSLSLSWPCFSNTELLPVLECVLIFLHSHLFCSSLKLLTTLISDFHLLMKILLCYRSNWQTATRSDLLLRNILIFSHILPCLSHSWKYDSVMHANYFWIKSSPENLWIIAIECSKWTVPRCDFDWWWSRRESELSTIAKDKWSSSWSKRLNLRSKWEINPTQHMTRGIKEKDKRWEWRNYKQSRRNNRATIRQHATPVPLRGTVFLIISIV